MILQKYDFSSKSQLPFCEHLRELGCLWYCKSTIFQANHNEFIDLAAQTLVVCDTAKVRFFKQITTDANTAYYVAELFVILQKYDFSSKSQPAVCEYITYQSCLWYCKSTIFQANHNVRTSQQPNAPVVCDTAKVRFFKQITTHGARSLQSYCCLWYCKSTIFQANHNHRLSKRLLSSVVCDTAKVRFFKQITTGELKAVAKLLLFVILQKYDFSSKSQQLLVDLFKRHVVCDTAKVRFFKQITTALRQVRARCRLFVILQKYDFSSKSQQGANILCVWCGCLWYCKSTIFQANHN